MTKFKIIDGNKNNINFLIDPVQGYEPKVNIKTSSNLMKKNMKVLFLKIH